MDFSCSVCNKSYKSYQSVWNHKKRFHSEENDYIDNKKRNFSCPNCNKKFTRKDSMSYHIKTSCAIKKTNDDKITKLEKQVAELQKLVLENTNTKNSNINNGTINKIGTENLLELNDKETSEIFSKEISGVVSLIKYINFNERLPSNHNFCTKSLEGKYMLTYNTEESKIESTRKKYFYQELLSTAVTKMELLYMKHKNKFAKDKQVKIEDTINRLKEIKDRDFSDKILREIKNQLIQLSYNCRNTVLNTWVNHKTEGKVVEEEKEQEFTDKQLEEFENMFIEGDDINTSDSDSDSDSPPKLKLDKLLNKKKPNEIVV
jgi:hypothetical protein